MDGTGRKIIVQDKLLDPTSVTLDTVKERLYWLDKKYDHLETCDYYGRKRHVIASGSTLLPHSLSLDIFENSLFYADSTKQAIMKLRRHTVLTQVHQELNHVNIDSAKDEPKRYKGLLTVIEFRSKIYPPNLLIFLN